MRTLRALLDDLRKTDNLNTIEEEIHWDLQAAAISAMSQRIGGPAIQFNKVTGYPEVALVGSLLSGPGYVYGYGPRKMHAKIAIGLGLEPTIHYDELLEIIGDRKRGPIMAIGVDTGPSQEVVVEGKDIDLFAFPVPKIHDKDGGRYLTSHVVMTRDAETAWTNWGVYRLMVLSRDRLVQGTLPGLTRPRDAETMVQKYAAKKEPLPFAIAIGVAPSLLYGAALLSPPMVDEAAIAGGFMLDPIPMVKAKLSDIMIPADAEIILEGHIYPGDMAEEGPFAWVSYYTPKVQNFVYRVELISHRRNPILPFVAEGTMTSDTVAIYSVFHSHELLEICRMMGQPMKFVTLPVEAKLCLAIASLAAKPIPGLAHKVAHTIFGFSPFARKAIVVDNDVDSEDVLMALNDMNTKGHPVRNLHISVADKPLGWTENHDLDTGLTSTMYMDATWRVDRDPATIASRTEFEACLPVELQKEVVRKWNEVFKLTPKAWRHGG